MKTQCTDGGFPFNCCLKTCSATPAAVSLAILEAWPDVAKEISATGQTALSRALWWPAHPTPEIFRLPKFEAPMQKLKNTTTRLKKQCPRKLAKGVVWCSVYTRVCLRRMFVGSCAYMHSAFWRSSPFYFHCHHYSSTFFAFSFHGGKWGDSGWL